MRQLITDRAQYTSEHVNTGFLKIWLDCAPLPPNNADSRLSEVGEIEKHKLLITEAELARVVADHDRQGMMVKMHTAGPGAGRHTG